MTGRKPIFENVLKVLRREVPSRPVLMELFMNGTVYAKFCDEKYAGDKTELGGIMRTASAFANLGYDYFTIHPSDFHFPSKKRSHKNTISLNEGFSIYDRKSFDEYEWQNPEDYSMEKLNAALPLLPEGMRAVMIGPSGVLENIIGLVGYDNLCMMLYEDPELVSDIAENVGSRLLRQYEMGAEYEIIGAAYGNDDWGFKTQTMISPAHMEKYIFPWHKKIVETLHKKGKPCILHSCGYPFEVMDNIIYDIKYDGRHSYEDIIMPVEEFYEKYHEKIAIIGGMDIDFIVTKTPQEIRERASAMLNRVSTRGGYALGTGNSVPEYIPMENYLAMLSAAYAFD